MIKLAIAELEKTAEHTRLISILSRFSYSHKQYRCPDRAQQFFGGDRVGGGIADPGGMAYSRP